MSFSPNLFDPVQELQSASNDRVGEAKADGPEPEPDPHPERIGHTDWCTCCHCVPMPTGRESICCRELGDACDRRIGDHVCVTLNPDFSAVCLHAGVLETALTMVHKFWARGPLPDPIPTRSYRVAAYRQFTHWVHGYLGKKNRRVIPSCVVSKVRTMYPDPNGIYVGYLDADEDIWPE